MSTVDESLSALVLLLAIGISLALYVWTALALGAMFRKMGDEPWKGWVPVLNVATVLRWGGFSPWLALLVLIPPGTIVVWVLFVISAHRINPGFGYRGAGMTVLAALLGLVWASILGFGPARWLGARIAGPVPQARRAAVEEPTAPEAAALFSPAANAGNAAPAAPVVAAWAPPPAPTADGDRDDDVRDRAAPPVPPLPSAAPITAAPTSAVPGATSRGEVADRPTSAAPPLAASEVPQPTRAALRTEGANAAASAGNDRERAARAAAADLGTRPMPTVSGEDAASSRDAAARDASASAAPDADPVQRGWAPPPTPAVSREWDTDMDEVSAVAPSVYPPSAAARDSHVPPVSLSDSDEPAGADVWTSRRPAAPVTRLPAGAPRVWASAPEDDRDAFPEMSGEVSAVVGSPAAGSPLSARRSVSAQQRDEEAPKVRVPVSAVPVPEEEEDDIDMTVVAKRKRPAWQLTPTAGTPIGLTGDVVILGRHPSPDPEYPRAQLVSLSDDTRTVSKTHARLELRSDGWHVTDLHSTNGVLLPTVLGTQIEIEAGSTVPAGEVFLLGDAEFRLSRR